MQEDLKILKMEWRSALMSTGIIAYATPRPNKENLWSAAIGYMENTVIMGVIVPNDEDEEAQYIAQNGAKLSWKEAQAFFPDMDIKNYKTHPDNL